MEKTKRQQQSPASEEPVAPKTKRSRNGCNECRRLHRRCDEGKPECQNCKDAGKSCSYNRTLSWGGRPFNKSPFRAALEGGVGEIATGSSFRDSSKSFVYGQVSSSKSTHRSVLAPGLKRTQSVPSAPTKETTRQSTWSTTSGTPSPLAWIPWLSEHHRTLFDHFANATIRIFSDNPAMHLAIRSLTVPMAADTNHGFSLLAAILSLASTHRMNLGIASDQAEIDYWRDMSVGHLRRPGIQEDGMTDNVFAATALMLCIRDAISNGERPLSWRLHLQGASTILRKSSSNLSPVEQEMRRMLTKFAISIQLRSLLPSSSTCSLDRMQQDFVPDACGMSPELILIMKDVRALRLERIALQAIESNSDSSNMGPLWSALKGRCLEVIVSAESIIDVDAARLGGAPVVHALYGHAAALQIYSGVLQLSNNDSGLRSSVNAAMALLRALTERPDAELSVMLLFPVLHIGSLVIETEDKLLVRWLLARIAAEQGRANATLAAAVLEELWSRSLVWDDDTEQMDLADWIVSKGWDLSLW
ncbi:uncharacterized protein LTR77_002533 [Saxophila tyrrhenica]|uniref:Zn(2)-C6 fungal-type domain-containing protein n=1 Tax=Saxophila tyrrhenica TaxID=1690608 RepID=A0AAV9PJ70_9PEZI|nr:hypothetical protein LTR77_002533 [Saxophila tyrrhenica]